MDAASYRGRESALSRRTLAQRRFSLQRLGRFSALRLESKKTQNSCVKLWETDAASVLPPWTNAPAPTSKAGRISFAC